MQLATLTVLALGVSVSSIVAQQRGDPDFVPKVARPAHGRGKGPVVLIDEGHHNFHTRTGRYAPFAKLLEADGYRVRSHPGKLSRESLEKADVLVLANALHHRNRRLWELPTPSAFTDEEIDAVVGFVLTGGSLFLIADHMPFPGAAAKLAARFGVRFENGFAFEKRADGQRVRRPMVFRRASASDAVHPITAVHAITEGSDPSERVRQVATFSGSAFRVTRKAAPLLILGESATLLSPRRAWSFDEKTPRKQISGWLQGAAIRHGEGRVAVFAEAAMFSAQRSSRGSRMGMNAPEAKDNRQLALNVLHWLSFRLGGRPTTVAPDEADGSRDPRALSLDLSAGWRVKQGDDVRWSDPSLDDSGWKSIAVGTAWEQAGLTDYIDHDGYAWYRLKFRVPRSWRQDPRLERHRRLRLDLGRIDDVDETWLNGKPVGSTGSFPDDYSPAWSDRRRYVFPAGSIRWDGDNVIAVRVYDGARHGGLYEGPYTLKVCSWRDLVSLRLAAGSGDGIYPQGQPMMLRAVLKSAAGVRLEGELRWKIETDAKAPVLERSRPWSVESGEVPVELEFAPAKAGFYRATCSFVRGKEELSHSMTLGYAPEKITAPTTARPDLKTFWSEARSELARIRPRFRTTPQPQDSDEHRTVHLVEMRSLGDVRVRGWYEVPRKPGKYPAVLRVPGYGQNLRPIRRHDDMIVFSFNVRGHGNSQDDVSGKPTDYWIRGLDDKRNYYYRGAYMDCIRAVDFLASRDEVDRQRIAITGGSQGGGLSFATAALDDRIRLCAPDIPFLADWVTYFELTQWPEMDDWIDAREERTWARTLETLSYFDTLNMAPWIECPVFMGVGLQDPICPPATVFAVFNRLRGPREYRVYPQARHNVGPGHRDRVHAWMRERFGLHRENE